MFATFCRYVVILALGLLCSPVHAFLPVPNISLIGAGAGQPTARLFGTSVATTAQHLAVGAPGTSAQNAPGSVWIYSRSGDQYSLLSVLQAPVPSAGDGFGQSLHWNGSQLLVGAPFATVSGLAQRGIVYVYNLQAGQFTLAQTLQPGVAVAQDDWFGFHVSSDAGWLAVGVPRAGASDQGQVQLYRLESNSWVYHSAITGTAVLGRLGLRTLMRGDRLLISAPEETFSGNTRGYLYDYLRTGNGAGASFALSQRFRPSVEVAGSPQTFGAALAISPAGIWLIAGAPFDLEPGNSDQRGAAFVFVRVSGVWTQVQRIPSPALARGENFGGAITFRDDLRVIIGDIRQSNPSGVQVGAVHEFQQISRGGWDAGRTWSRGNGISQDFFGNAIAFANGHLIVGSAGHDDGANVDVGRAHVYVSVFKDGFE